MKRYLVLVTLFLLFGAVTASAQVTYQITSTPTFVVNDGRSEVVGSVRITATNAVPTIASSVQFLFINTPCDNDQTNGIVLNTSGIYTGGVNALVASVSNTAGGCVVVVSIVGAITPAIGNFVEVQGVRGRIDMSPGLVVNTDLNASLNATPSNSSLFTAPSIVRVATSQPGLVVAVRNGVQLLCLPPPPNPTPRVTVTEGFPGAFVHHVTGPSLVAPPADMRMDVNLAAIGGALNNTQIRIVVTGTPTGVTLTWPATAVDTVVGVATLRNISTSVTATTQVYEFTTTAQGTSDLNVEQFEIIPTVTIGAITQGVQPVTYAQVDLWPGLIAADATAITDAPFGLAPTVAAKPRFNDPLTAAAALLTISPCTTNLLFPWVANVAGYDTGLAIVNTTTDPYATPAQAGTCVIHGYPMGGGTAVALTTPSVASGDASTMVMSSADNAAFNGWAGYIIAVCNFQFGHGFAYITDNFGVAAPATAQGYVAQIIPDPLTLGARAAQSPTSLTVNGIITWLDSILPGVAPATIPPYGEGLEQ